MLTASLNGILVEPRAPYLLGFIALGVLYGIVSLEWRNRNKAGQAVPKYGVRFLYTGVFQGSRNRATLPLGLSTAAEGSPPRPQRPTVRNAREDHLVIYGRRSSAGPRRENC